MRILGQRVLLEQLPDVKMHGSYWLAEKYIPEQQVHRVLQIGEKVEPGLCVGDLVLLDQYSIGNRTYVDGRRWIINAADISLAVGS